MSERTENVSRHKLNVRKDENKEEMVQQVITFALMILFTLIAFSMVILDISSYFIKPTLLLLAGVQVAFQLFYFMHMKNKGHFMPTIIMFGGMTIALATIIAFTTIIWW
ncbi:cytochrome c oxidase subunit IVB [Salimicrobium jeotgali]|uniref:Cytochrome c oxidase subunit IV n=1 Tax=Salimicrobium jeotgali TaxID=1230341 RepID=K2GN43_9BACI|nr:cytochrome c oxidase subunit IVB [Salimicrobium jeotgali]AKG04674.1 cytochrome c oxidase subunit IVB [Salimicrobium jeotgali]EKE31829.1 cytochrome c oxidase subunit IV [Salimicrobium jeotgali]MBM7696208.1 cytochrome c oxidase subunit 4 [Salimicrobium jeotgali]